MTPYSEVHCPPRHQLYDNSISASHHRSTGSASVFVYDFVPIQVSRRKEPLDSSEFRPLDLKTILKPRDDRLDPKRQEGLFPDKNNGRPFTCALPVVVNEIRPIVATIDPTLSPRVHEAIMSRVVLSRRQHTFPYSRTRRR